MTEDQDPLDELIRQSLQREAEKGYTSGGTDSLAAIRRRIQDESVRAGFSHRDPGRPR